MIFARNAVSLLALLCLLVAGPGASAGDWVYVTKQGDTLWDICIEYSNKQGCWVELGKYNDIQDERAIPVGTEIRMPETWLAAPPVAVVARVLSVEGEVAYTAAESGAEAPLAVGQTLAPGDRIVSRGGGSAVLQLGDHDTVLVRPGSDLTLRKVGAGQTTELMLEEGAVEADVQPAGGESRFRITTPSAVAAVRGTSYRVVAEDVAGAAVTRSEVTTGVVGVEAAGASVEVPAGYGVLAREGEAPGEPRKLLAAPLLEDSRLVAPLPVAVRWRRDPQASAWQVEVRRSGAKGAVVQSHTLSENELLLSGLGEECYAVVVRGIDADGFHGLESSLQLCVEPAPPPLEEEQRRPFWWIVAVAGVLALILAL